MKKIAILGLILVAVVGVFVYVYLNFNTTKEPSQISFSSIKDDQMAGDDKDEHGCTPSAGYIWCEASQKCLRPWEEKCSVEIPNSEEGGLEYAIKKLFIDKYGPDAEDFVVNITDNMGEYAKGEVNPPDEGGGLWFASRANGQWALVWDGNGIIECGSLEDFPEFPASLIPQCYDTATEQMIER